MSQETPPRRHRLLERQLKAAARVSADGSVDLETLLDLVSAAYEEQEEARRHNDQAINLVSREVTELNQQLREEAEARSREAARMNMLLDNASEAIISTGGGTIITGFNRAAERTFGYTAEEMIGQDAIMLFAGDLDDTHQKMSAARVNRPDTSIIIDCLEISARRKSGEVFPTEVSLSELQFEGEVLRIGFHRDISARKAAEAAIVAARDEAQAANHAKSEFLAAMSHEIRTPLNGVLGMAAALEFTELSKQQRAMLGTINESGQILMTLLSDILDLSKIEAGRLVLEATPFDVSASLQAVARLYAETAARKDLGYEVEVSEAAKGWFVGDPTRYRQVLQNLVSNALKFTEIGQVRISLDAEPAPEGQMRLTTKVTDTGLGVTSEARKRLFQKFSQADASTTRKFGGTGLGLAISRQLVEALGGDIGVESKPGCGSCFWFTLPMTVAEARLEPAEAPVAVSTEARSTVRILAAEDNKTNQLVLGALLAQADVDVMFVDNGAEAVDAVRDHDFDLILMDVQMPVMDGIAASGVIRAMDGPRGRTPIIAVTADAMPEQVALCMSAGIDAHVSKPLRPDNLFSVIDEVLSRVRQAPAAIMAKAG